MHVLCTSLPQIGAHRHSTSTHAHVRRRTRYIHAHAHKSKKTHTPMHKSTENSFKSNKLYVKVINMKVPGYGGGHSDLTSYTQRVHIHPQNAQLFLALLMAVRPSLRDRRCQPPYATLCFVCSTRPRYALLAEETVCFVEAMGRGHPQHTTHTHTNTLVCQYVILVRLFPVASRFFRTQVARVHTRH